MVCARGVVFNYAPSQGEEEETEEGEDVVDNDVSCYISFFSGELNKLCYFVQYLKLKKQ